MVLSSSQANAVKFYQGDVSGTDPFWGDKKAYCTLNTLFFPGIENELSRSHEGKRLNPAFLEDIPRLTGLCTDLLSAFCVARTESAMSTWRVERLNDFSMRRASCSTISFTSTSTAGLLDAYGDKKGLAIIRFDLPAGTPCIDMSKVLDNYLKADEAEVLLPPCLSLSFEEMPLTAEMLNVRDIDGNPPVIACMAAAGQIVIPKNEHDDPITDSGAESGRRIYQALNHHTAPDKSDIHKFIRWKAAFQKTVLENASILQL